MTATIALALASVLGTPVPLAVPPEGLTAAPAPLAFGMSTVLTGPAADLGLEMRRGVLACFERVNRAGGIAGRRLELVALDDGYEPERTAPNMRRLIDQSNVLAAVGNVGTPTAIAAIPICIEERVLLFAPFTGAGVLRRSPPDRYVINFRASYAEETAAMIDALLGPAGLAPEDVAFFTQRDAYGDAGYAGGLAALRRHEPVDELAILHVHYERNSEIVEGALAELLVAKRPPRAVVMVGAYAPCAKFIRLARDAGLRSLFLNVSFVGSSSLAQLLPPGTPGVIVTQVVPDPERQDLPLVAEYRADLEQFAAGAEPNFGSLEGYAAARVLCRAVAAAGEAPTRDGLVTALESLGTFDLGLGLPLELSPERHQASDAVWPTVFRDGRFVSFDFADLAAVLASAERP